MESANAFVLKAGDHEFFSSATETAEQQLEACVRQLRELAALQSHETWQKAPEVLGQAAALFLEDGSVWRLRAVEVGEKIGMAPEMVREALRNFFGRLTPQALLELRQSQLCLPEGSTPLVPSLVFHVLAGNLFVSGVESMVMGALSGACNLVRCSSDDVHFPLLWLKAIHEVDREFARTLAVGYWPREEERLTKLACREADAVVVFGTDESVSNVRRLCPPERKLLAHGAKLSFAVVGKESLDLLSSAEIAARELAYDFSVYDQQGCLSPRAAFIEQGGAVSPRQFALLLRGEMLEAAGRLPRRELSLEESAALARSRDEALIEAASGGNAQLVSKAADPFLITLRSARTYTPGCLNRYADLRVFEEGEELESALAPYRARISAIGVSGEDDRWSELYRRLRVPRVCPTGQMQKPPLGWTHDGRLTLLDLVDLMQMEERAGS